MKVDDKVRLKTTISVVVDEAEGHVQPFDPDRPDDIVVRFKIPAMTRTIRFFDKDLWSCLEVIEGDTP